MAASSLTETSTIKALQPTARTPGGSHIKSSANPFEQQSMIERFCKELDCAPSHGLYPHPGVSMSSNKNYGNVGFLFFQPSLQLQTRHLRHANVNDQARSLTI